MTLYNTLVLVHILLFVYWLGTDLGVFYTSFFVLNRDLSTETRLQMAKVLLNLDLGPRICLVLMLPVGFTLAGEMGISPVTGPWLAAIWVAAIAWLAVVLTIHVQHGSKLGTLLTKGDGVFRGLLVLVLAAVAVTSLVGDGPLLTTWLPVKILLFAVALASGLGIRLALKPFGPALQQLVAGEQIERAEGDLARSMRATYPLVITIWLAIVGAAAMGVMRL